MKTLSILLVFLSFTGFANTIDSIKTKQDVIEFMHKNFSDSYMGVERLSEKFTHVNTDSFYVLDIDRNGLSDLFIYGTDFWIIRDKGGKYEHESLWNFHIFRGFNQTDSVTYIQIRTEEPVDQRQEKTTDTSIFYKNNRLIEYVADREIHTIKKIEYDYDPGFCFDCNSFSLTIDSNGAALYTSVRSNYKTGRLDTVKMSTQLSSDDYRALTDHLNYIHFSKLQERYSAFAVDMPAYRLNIAYDNGSIKRITDKRGGTFGLLYFYQLIDEYIETLKWNKTVVRGPKLKKVYKF